MVKQDQKEVGWISGRMKCRIIKKSLSAYASPRLPTGEGTCCSFSRQQLPKDWKKYGHSNEWPYHPGVPELSQQLWIESGGERQNRHHPHPDHPINRLHIVNI